MDKAPSRNDKREKPPDGGVEGTIRILVADQGTVSSGEVARAAGVTRQAARYHLARLVERGDLHRLGPGRGRGTRYGRTAALALRLPLSGLEEDVIWDRIRGDLPKIPNAPENVESILRYAFTEMLNNAVDHSGGNEVTIMFWVPGERWAFEVYDDGIGAFRHVRERLGLEDDEAALEQLTKGRETTAPERHTGEGIFFTSHMVDRFELDANRLRWIVDTERGDQAVGESPEHPGTRVRCEVDPETERTTLEIFDAFVDRDTFEFSRTIVPLRVFRRGDRFISRSEAKRLGTRLDRFNEAVLDFDGIKEVGQGFVDELFRVWARDHPGTRLLPVNMSPVVERVVLRALPRS